MLGFLFSLKPGILTGRALLLMLGSSLIIAPSIMKTTHRLVMIAV